jgi:AraC family transcriptional regulator of adaptative response/methylated-DNA-[protein]-cysteine methyltransferase
MNNAAASIRDEGSPIFWLTTPSPWGQLLVAATERGICLLQFMNESTAPAEALAGEFPAGRYVPADSGAANRIRQWLRSAWQALAANQEPKIPLDLLGTPFQKRVWAYLRTIPPGKPSTYTAVAHAIGQPRAVRAVASACARNRVALLVPCHRVTRMGGAPGGYRWGSERKRALLAAEAEAARPLKAPRGQ